MRLINSERAVGAAVMVKETRGQENSTAMKQIREGDNKGDKYIF